MDIPVDNIYLDALKAFGHQIEERRHSSQWSALVLSEKASVDVWVVGEIERGDPRPTAAERERVAYFLGLPIDTFDKLLRQLRRKDAADRGLNVVDMSQYRK